MIWVVERQFSTCLERRLPTCHHTANKHIQVPAVWIRGENAVVESTLWKATGVECVIYRHQPLPRRALLQTTSKYYFCCTRAALLPPPFSEKLAGQAYLPRSHHRHAPYVRLEFQCAQFLHSEGRHAKVATTLPRCRILPWTMCRSRNLNPPAKTVRKTREPTA